MQWKLCQSCLLRSLVAKLDGCIAPTARSTFNGQNVWSYLVCEGGLWAGGNGLDGNTGILESPGTITISTLCCLYCILASNMFLAFSRSKYVNEYWAGEWGTYQCHIALPVHRKYWYRSWKPTLKKSLIDHYLRQLKGKGKGSKLGHASGFNAHIQTQAPHLQFVCCQIFLDQLFFISSKAGILELGDIESFMTCSLGTNHLSEWREVCCFSCLKNMIAMSEIFNRHAICERCVLFGPDLWASWLCPQLPADRESTSWCDIVSWICTSMIYAEIVHYENVSGSLVYFKFQMVSPRFNCSAAWHRTAVWIALLHGLLTVAWNSIGWH